VAATSWHDLIYVANIDTSISNFDGTVDGLPAFKIDNIGCDPSGINHPLAFGDFNGNCIFEPGETWEINIDDYFNSFGTPPENLNSLGLGFGTSPSSGSIIAFAEEEPPGEPPVIFPGDMIGSGGSQGIDPGSIFLISKVDGSQTLIGDPTVTGGLSGLAFDDFNRLWGSNVFGGGDPGSNLLEINPSDGSLINDVGAIQTAIAVDVKIQDLGFDPVSKKLFGTAQGTLYTINEITGISSPV